MKKIATLAIAAMMSIALMAQNPQSRQNNQNPQGKRPNPEQMEQMQCKRIIEELALDNRTADIFVKVYKEYKAELRVVREQFKPVRPNREAGETRLSDEQVEANILAGFAQSRAIVDVREKYYSEFRKTLSPQQIEKIFNEEKRQAASIQQEMHHRGGRH